MYDGGGVGRLNLGFDVEESTDSVAPVITLNGDSNITLLQDEAYQELGATAIDDIDGNVSVEISGEVDSATVGSYIITYTAIDNAGNEATATRTVTITEPTLKKLTLETNTTLLNVGDEVKLTVVGRYNNNTTKQIDLDSNIELLLTPKGSVDINGTTLVAKRDGNVTVQAKVDNTLSNSLSFGIKWVVDGHTLPPVLEY